MTLRLVQCLLVMICYSQLTSLLLAQSVDTRLQGVWFGDGRHPLNRKVLIVDGEKLVVITPLGAFVSKFVANDTPFLNEIDIDRFDGGQQLGVYEVSENKLRMKLSEPSKSRPTLDDVRFPNGKPHWHTIFDRRPTPEGLEVLKKHLDKLPAGENTALQL